MKKKVIKLTESDIERLVNKILNEGDVNELATATHRREDLMPAIADVRGDKRLVIVNKEGDVEAMGPQAKVLKGMTRERICGIVEKLITDMFDLVEEEELNELDKGDFTNIKLINFCPPPQKKKQ